VFPEIKLEDVPDKRRLLLVFPEISTSREYLDSLKTLKLPQELTRVLLQNKSTNIIETSMKLLSPYKVNNVDAILRNKVAKTPASKPQVRIYELLKDLFPDYEIIFNYRHAIGRSNRPLFAEFDIFIPRLSLGFEYQGISQLLFFVTSFLGETHYVTSRAYGSAAKKQATDIKKKRFAEVNGITLVEIPYWWDTKIESLAATIHSYRPDLLQDTPGKPILPSPPRTPS
jgi:hypothetical protein